MSVDFDQLSPDQVQAVEAAVQWYNSRDSRPFYISGPAGSGKTTVAGHVIAALGTTTQALAPTNRAARILRTKGVHEARTIHSVLFQPQPWCWTYNHQVDSTCIQEESKHTHGPRFFKRADPPEGVRCFTIDEASMVGERIGDDVALFGIKTIAIGDPYQLPPVGDSAAYLVEDLPGVALEVSHRFDSLSDIGKLANTIRTSSGLKDWKKLIPYVDFSVVDSYDLLLAWRNETRWQIITTLRSIRGRNLEVPQVGDRLISVANTYEVGILNADELMVTGEPYPATHLGAWNIPTDRGVVQAWKSGFVDFEGEKWAAQQSRRKGTDICALTWSECMTVHKAQGGEWDRVLVVDDLAKMDWAFRDEKGGINTWAYTAVTRAKTQVDFIKIGAFPTGMALRKLIASRVPA
jgi:exodeoxyribonuclease-5